MESIRQKIQVKETQKRRKGDFTKTEVYQRFKEVGGVEYRPMINELSYRTHLPKWVCEKVYDAEAAILEDLNILH